MTGALRRVLVRAPRAEDLGGWRMCGWRAEPDAAGIAREHEAFCSLISDAGAEVVVAESAATGNPDAIYTYDPALMADDGALLLNPGKECRRGEPAALGEDFDRIGVPIAGRLEGDEWAEGGDCCWLDEQTLLLGRGYRTNDAGIEALRRMLPDDEAPDGAGRRRGAGVRGHGALEGRRRPALPHTPGASRQLSAKATASSGVSVRGTPSSSKPGSRITTGRPSTWAKPISASVPHLPPTAITASPEATTARFRACPTPVTTAWSIHWFASARVWPGRMRIVVPPADFAPRAAASITSPSPPLTTVQPRSARSRPTSSARGSCSRPLPMTATWTPATAR